MTALWQPEMIKWVFLDVIDLSLIVTDYTIIIQYSEILTSVWKGRKIPTCSGGCVLSWGTYSWRSSGSSRRRCRWRCWSGRSWRARSGCRPPPRTGSAAARPRTCSQCGSWVQARLKLRKNIKAKFKKYILLKLKIFENTKILVTSMGVVWWHPWYEIRVYICIVRWGGGHWADCGQDLWWRGYRVFVLDTG